MRRPSVLNRITGAALAAILLAAVGVSVAVAAHTDSDPDPRRVVLTGEGFRCTGPVDLDLVRVTNPPGDGVTLASGCTGRIGRLELSGVRNGDGIKVQNADANAARDLVIAGGYVRCAGAATDGTHQDGVQAMGGRNITFRNLSIDCYGGGGGNFFVQRAGGGATTPTNIVCDGCALGPRHPNNVQVNGSSSIGSGVRDSLICRPLSGRNPIMGAPAVNAGNQIVPSGDPSCTIEGLTAWANGGATEPPPPPPTTPPPPPPPPAVCDAVCVANYENTISGLRSQVTGLTGQLAAAQAEVARLGSIIDRIAATALER